MFKKHKARIVRYGILSANIVALVGVVLFVSKTPETNTVSRQNSLANAAPAAGPLDQLSSADIAVHAARMTALPESVAVANQADSEATQLAITATETKVVAKPQVVATGLKSAKDIFTYKTVEGDSLDSLASKFGVTSDSIRWSNGLSGARLAVGTDLVIPPVTGIVYTVKSGDTPDSVAQRYSASKEQILADNDAEVLGLKVSQRILIRNGVQPVARASYSFAPANFRAVYGYNGYDYGWCTWHAANRRSQIGKPLPSNLGNANTWYSRASAGGMGVGTTPAAGAVLWHANMRGLGHVAYVEKVNDDGSLLVSDMNYPSWGRVTYRTVNPGEFGSYRFIY